MNQYLLLTLFLLTLHTQAQRIINVTAEQQGQELIIGYTLDSNAPVQVELFVSTDSGNNWQGPLSNCSGDVGENITAGAKRIRWAVLEERELVGDEIRFKVVAKLDQLDDAQSEARKFFDDAIRSGGLKGGVVVRISEGLAYRIPAENIDDPKVNKDDHYFYFLPIQKGQNSGEWFSHDKMGNKLDFGSYELSDTIPRSANKPWLNSSLVYGSVTDIDGNTYATIQIGTQVWMAENLRTSRYQNGDLIPNVPENDKWMYLNYGAWCHYENDVVYEVPYGKLYNWFAVADPRNACPVGWHVPFDAEWTILETALGMTASELHDTGWRGVIQSVGSKMKSTGNQYWRGLNNGATNSSGFSGLPVGQRYALSGSFGTLDLYGNWWSASESGSKYGWQRRLGRADSGIFRDDLEFKLDGFSVRCIRD